MARFTGKRAIVTAAASGIGRATALRLAEEDVAALVLIDIDAAGLARTRDAIFGTVAETLVLDCTDPGAIGAAFESIAQSQIDVLVNGVGGSARAKASPFVDSHIETWQDVIALSLISAMACTHAVLPSMLARGGGRIVNISTDAAFRPERLLVDYAAAKAGVSGFTRALAHEVAASGITVNAVSPGPIETAVWEHLTDEVKTSATAGVPMARAGRPEEVAAAIAFLASDDASYITGQTLPVNGGRHMV